MAEVGQKRKRPPTFQHLPINRAKKLKKTWVENVKIKSKWKDQKRREALLLSSTPHGEGEPNGSKGDDSEKEEEQEGESTPRKPTLHPSRAHIHPELVPKITSKPQQVEKDKESATPAPSLRELTREAYSRSSLHTFKADPLKRRRGSQAPGRGQGESRDKNAQRGERGRGQPNMKLRMGAMLEKIKRDLA